MPLFTFGKLQIAVSAKTQGVSLPEAAKTEFDWKWYWTVPRLLPWLLIALLLLLRPNRNPRTWAILLPLAAISGLAWIEAHVSTDIPGIGEEETARHAAYAIGLAALCLTAAWFSTQKRRLARRAAFGVLFVSSALSQVFLSGLYSQWTDARYVWVRPAFQTVGLMAALALVRLTCRKHLRPCLFVFWVTVYVPAMAWIASFLFLLLSEIYKHIYFPISLFSLYSRSQCLEYFAEEALADCITAYVILLPFLLLLRFNNLHREHLAFLGPSSPGE